MLQLFCILRSCSQKFNRLFFPECDKEPYKYLIKLIVPPIKPMEACILSNQLVRSSSDKAVLRKRNRSRKIDITALNIIGYG